MEYFSHFLNAKDITWESALIRVLFSFVLGTLVGIEREIQNQPAGLRTHILISIGSTIVMLISIYLPQTFTNFQNGDPGRIAAQVVSGIGFLGAGAILKFGTDIKGLTTAASIWAMAAIGLAVGAGMFAISLIGIVVILFALTIMDIFEKKFFRERTLRKIELIVKKKDSDLQDVKETLLSQNVKIVSTGFERNINEANDKITLMVAVRANLDIQKLSNVLEEKSGVVSISVFIQ